MKITVNHDARKIPVNGLYGRNIGPYTGVQYDVTVDFGRGRKYRLATYQAYNALGLIGSENGIVILDETKRSVVADEVEKQNTGYFGASESQFKLIDALSSVKWPEFKKVVNDCLRLRYVI